ncbi:protein lin-12 [Lingula anatina]|uniref:Protein lin-12 n=1 Tax=Lingula anatina TaxID=7574 RepID=A0A1S3ICI1_LINAN|nr:protein lin-12 [Lingula anatina]|eukprot:XP_013395134.1 protein lin-12 [Lingula anatina]
MWDFSCVVVLGLLRFVTSESTGSYYFPSPHQPCQSISSKGGTLDLVFRILESDLNETCDEKTIQWTRNGVKIDGVQNSDKYGVWTAGWGVMAGEYVSLLRIRSVQPADLGKYSCHIECVGHGFNKHTVTVSTQVCLNLEGEAVICQPYSDTCRSKFLNGQCDSECNGPEELFDGFDCRRKIAPCNRLYDNYCRRSFANGVCDRGCRAEGCAYDGGDCPSRQTPNVFHGKFVAVTSQEPDVLKVDLKAFLWRLSRLLRTIVTVDQDLQFRTYLSGTTSTKLENYINYAIIPWTNLKNTSIDYRWQDYGKILKSGSAVYLKLANANCDLYCFQTAEMVTNYIAESLRRGWDPGIPLTGVGVPRAVPLCQKQYGSLLDNIPEAESSTNINYKKNANNDSGSTSNSILDFITSIDLGILIGAGLGLVALLILVIGVVCICAPAKRKVPRKEAEKLPDIRKPEHVIKGSKQKQWEVTVTNENGTKC